MILPILGNTDILSELRSLSVLFIFYTYETFIDQFVIVGFLELIKHNHSIFDNDILWNKIIIIQVYKTKTELSHKFSKYAECKYILPLKSIMN